MSTSRLSYPHHLVRGDVHFQVTDDGFFARPCESTGRPYIVSVESVLAGVSDAGTSRITWRGSWCRMGCGIRSGYKATQ